MNNMRNQVRPAPTPAPNPTPNKPVHSIRLGAIKAAIWENSVGDTIRHNVTVCRIYKDGDQWKNADSFGRDDLLVLAKVADQAHTWICEHRSQPVNNNP